MNKGGNDCWNGTKCMCGGRSKLSFEGCAGVKSGELGGWEQTLSTKEIACTKASFTLSDL